ncbi:GntR family transcriptional regulator [Nocardiopsis mangrovi]|uniref:GntR family transcriptional regulator n=1 Tax=Nocardiopsis mangrovi TaxID=1179818 RepID=A0ABV9E2Q6_9ACTN
MADLEQPRARYKQVAEMLREAIKTGEYPVGTTLPSQPELARTYGLNQSSISRAMAMLQAEGCIRTEHGRGSVVLEVPKVKRVRRIDKEHRSQPGDSTYAEEIAKSGLTPRNQLVRCESVEPPPDIAEALRLEEGEETLIRQRQMFAGHRPIQIATSYIPMEIAGSVDIAMPDTGPTGMYARMASRGFGPVRFTEDIEVRGAANPEAMFLDIVTGQPVFAVLRTAYDEEGRPVEACMNILAALQWRLSYSWTQERDA